MVFHYDIHAHIWLMMVALCATASLVVGDCSEIAHKKVPTQRTHCATASQNNGIFTCNNPTISFGTTYGGTPCKHDGNDDDVWCQEMGFEKAAGSDVVEGSIVKGKLFGCTDNPYLTLWRWCDWQDTVWESSTLGSDGTCDKITQIRCVYGRDNDQCLPAYTTTATSTTTATTTTTTYKPQDCHGFSEPVGCGTRIPTGDCVAGGEHQQFAEKICPAMCGLDCTSSTTTTTTGTITTTTMTSATSTTTTTTTATITSTTVTTATSFTTTTVLNLNANCNPRDDRCDAQEGLACDPVHNECRHADAVTIPPFLKAEVDRLIEEAVAEKDQDMTTLAATKDAEIAALKIAALTAANGIGCDISALTATKDASIADLTASNHEQEIALVTCNTKLEARRLSRLAEAAEDLAAHTQGAASTDDLAADSSSWTLGLAIGICAGIVVLATAINVMLRCRRTDDGDDQNGGSNAFVNPMYSEKNERAAPVNNAVSTAGAVASSTVDSHVYGGNSALQEEAYEELAGSPNTYNSAAAAEDTYEDVVGGSAAETYADIPAGTAEESYEEISNVDNNNYLNVQNGEDDLNC